MKRFKYYRIILNNVTSLSHIIKDNGVVISSMKKTQLWDRELI